MSLSLVITGTRFKSARASFGERARLVGAFPAERLFALSGRADVRASNTGVHGDENHLHATCTISILSAGVNDCDPLTKVQERACEAQRGRPLMCCCKMFQAAVSCSGASRCQLEYSEIKEENCQTAVLLIFLYGFDRV